jgi:hypothetical protein
VKFIAALFALAQYRRRHTELMAELLALADNPGA